MHSDFKVRGVLPDDVEYLLKTWGREVEASKPHYPNGKPAMPKRLFFDEYQLVMQALIRSTHARVVVPATDSSFIAAFVIANVYPDATTALVHFAYTRPPFRRLGLCTAALQDLGYEPGFELVATHWTKYMNRIMRDDLIFNDYALYGVKV